MHANVGEPRARLASRDTSDWRVHLRDAGRRERVILRVRGTHRDIYRALNRA